MPKFAAKNQHYILTSILQKKGKAGKNKNTSLKMYLYSYIYLRCCTRTYVWMREIERETNRIDREAALGGVASSYRFTSDAIIRLEGLHKEV